jgi:hypothetical protein
MLYALPSSSTRNASAAFQEPPIDYHDTVVTRLWSDEHDWLFSLLRSEHNVSPTFRLPDLIGACITLIANGHDASAQIFRFLATELNLRATSPQRHRESIWREHYELLHDLQRSPANRHPNPMYQLDQLTTACVALARRLEGAEPRVLAQARLNLAHRSAGQPAPSSG